VPDPRVSPARTAARVAVGYVAALNEGDADAVVACVAEGFENVHPGTGAPGSLGREAYRARLPGFFATLRGLRYEVRALQAEGGHVGLDYVLTATAEGPDGSWRPLRVAGRFELEVVDGLVARRVDTWDPTEVARQLAPPS
jgi:hypothetical protein